MSSNHQLIQRIKIRDELKRLGINHARTMINTPKGNAVIERFFRTLKQECMWINHFENFDQAKPIAEAWVHTPPPRKMEKPPEEQTS